MRNLGLGERVAIPDVGWEIAVMLVTPTMARQWLATKHPNRTIKQAPVDRYVRAILGGLWQLTGDAVCFDADGYLWEAQHRLTAIVKADQPALLLCIWGVSELSRDVMGEGAKKGLADKLTLHGVARAGDVAALVRIIAGGLEAALRGGTSKELGAPEGLALYREHEASIEEAVMAGRRSRGESLYASYRVPASLYFLFRQADPDEAETFWDLLVAGEGLFDGNAIFALRRQLKANTQLPVERRKGAVDEAALTIKAFNAWRRDANAIVRVIIWRRGGRGAEAFPTIEPKASEAP